MILKGKSENAVNVHYQKEIKTVYYENKKIWKREDEKDIEHYGIKIEKENNDAYARCTYLYDAVGLTPKTVNNGAGGFANAFFVKNNYPVMCKYDGSEDYKLDPNDHSKKINGTPSDVSNSSYQGNAMSCFNGTIWMKFYEDENYTYIEVANKKLDKDFVNWPYIRANGTVANKIYYPMFEGIIIDGKLRSLAIGKGMGNTTATQELEYAQANGSNWTIGDWGHYLWIIALMTLMGKTTDIQYSFGYGNVYGGESSEDLVDNGQCLTNGQFYGSEWDDEPVKAFYCENIYGNREKRTLGFYNDQGIYYLKIKPPYTTDGSHQDYINCGQAVQYEYWTTLKNVRVSECGLVPGETDQYTENGYYEDEFININTGCYLLTVGGYCDYGLKYGPWTFNLSFTHDYSQEFVGASLYLIQK